jgi:hypothetical protein
LACIFDRIAEFAGRVSKDIVSVSVEGDDLVATMEVSLAPFTVDVTWKSAFATLFVTATSGQRLLVQVKSLACELPHRLQSPLSRL